MRRHPLFLSYALAVLSMASSLSYAAQTAWYVTFSGESATPINNIYVLSKTTGAFISTLAPTATGFHELRNMVIGPDNKLYVTNANKDDSRVVVFSSLNPDGITRHFLGNFVTPLNSAGLVHPYFITFNPLGDLYVSIQDTNVVLGFYGPNSSLASRAKPLSPFLQTAFSGGTFFAGTFIPAFSAKIPPVTSVPQNQGGLTGNVTHSVRGIAFAPNHTLYVADEGNDRIDEYNSDTGELINIISDSHTIKPDQLFFNLSDGLIYIACPGDNRIEVYNPQTQTLSTFIHDPARLSAASGIAFGEDGNFYVGDRAAMVIYQYDSAGNFIKIFAGPFTDAPEGIMPLYQSYP